jgi:hypothetical protein
MSNPYTRDDLRSRIARLEHALCIAEYRREQAEQKLRTISILLTAEAESKVRFTSHTASTYIENALAAAEADTDAT